MVCIGILHAAAQQWPADSSRQLPEFITTTTRFNTFTTGVKTGKTDSLTRLITGQNNLAQLLSYNSPVFVKSYGPMQLSTTSFRGAGAEHTAVLWNGMNLQSNMHGQLDFSLIPAGFMDEIDLHYGGNSALFGAGAIGGAIILGNTSAFNKKISVSYSPAIGSFGLKQHWAMIAQGTAKFYFKAKAYYTAAQNDFGYYNYTLAGNPLEYRKHADYAGKGTMLETGYRINARQELNVRYWYAYANRNLPPTIGMASNSSYQVDETSRLGVDWKHTGIKSRWTARAAWLTERLDYDDPSTFLTGRSHSGSVISELENNCEISKRVQLNAGINFSHLEATSEKYIRSGIQNRLAGFASVKLIPLKKLTTTISLRQELINAAWQPFTASAGLDYALLKWISFTAHANKSYRVPTFNDLYWITGNPDLKPEGGYGQELGVNIKLTNVKHFFTIQLNAFNRNISNWIVWQPNGGTWTPQNLKEVWSRGGELSYRYTRTLARTVIMLRGDFSYVLSTNEKGSYANDASVGKQLIYIPRFTHQHWLSMTWKKFYLAYNATYTGYRFTSADNSAFLNDYNLGNVFTGYGFSYKKTGFDIRFQYNNIFNRRYEVLPAKPMPMSNFLLSLTIQLNT